MFTRQQVITVAGPTTQAVQMMPPDPKRIMMVFRDPTAGSVEFGSAQSLVTGTGIICSVANPNLYFFWRDWGLFVQSAWYALNNGLGNIDVTVLSLIAETNADLSLAGMGIRAAPDVPISLQGAAWPPVPVVPETGDSFEQLRNRVKGKLWQLSQKPN